MSSVKSGTIDNQGNVIATDDTSIIGLIVVKNKIVHPCQGMKSELVSNIVFFVFDNRHEVDASALRTGNRRFNVNL